MDPHPTDAAPTSPLTTKIAAGEPTSSIIESPYNMRLRRLGFSDEQIAHQAAMENEQAVAKKRAASERLLRHQGYSDAKIADLLKQVDAETRAAIKQRDLALIAKQRERAQIEKERIEYHNATATEKLVLEKRYALEMNAGIEAKEKAEKARPLTTKLHRMYQKGEGFIGPEYRVTPIAPHVIKVEDAWRPYGAKWPDTNLVDGVTEEEHLTWFGATTYEGAQQGWKVRRAHAQVIADQTMTQLGDEAAMFRMLPDETLMLVFFPPEIAYTAIRHWEVSRLGLPGGGVKMFRLGVLMKWYRDKTERQAADLVLANPESSTDDVTRAQARLSRPAIVRPLWLHTTDEEAEIAGRMYDVEVAWEKAAPILRMEAVNRYNEITFRAEMDYLNEKVEAWELTVDMTKLLAMVLLFPAVDALAERLAPLVAAAPADLTTLATVSKPLRTLLTWAAFEGMDRAMALANTGAVLDHPMREFESLHSALWSLLYSLPIGGLGWFALSMAASFLEEKVLRWAITTNPNSFILNGVGTATAQKIRKALEGE